MTTHAYIHELRLCPLRPRGPLPRVSTRLLELVEDHGAVEPVVVRRVGRTYEILGNVQMWLAAQKVGLDQVPVHVLEHISDMDATELLEAAFAGFCANPIEVAEYFQSQVTTNKNGRSRHQAVMKLAYQTGHSRSYISHSLRLLKLPEEIQTFVRTGRLSAGHARALISLKTRSTQLALAKRAVAGMLSVRQIEVLVQEVRDGVAMRSKTQEAVKGGNNLDPNIVLLQNLISEKIGCKASINLQSNRLSIDYHNLDILDGILAKLGIPIT